MKKKVFCFTVKAVNNVTGEACMCETYFTHPNYAIRYVRKLHKDWENFDVIECTSETLHFKLAHLEAVVNDAFRCGVKSDFMWENVHRLITQIVNIRHIIKYGK